MISLEQVKSFTTNLTPSHYLNQLCWVNSLRPSDVIRRQGTESTLAQVMACCLMAPSHYLNQCWLIISKVLWHYHQGALSWVNLKIPLSKTRFKNTFLESHSDLSEANELTIDTWIWLYKAEKPCTMHHQSNHKTHHPLGDLNGILGKKFSSSFQWSMAELPLVKLSWDECHWTVLMISKVNTSSGTA